MSGFISTTGRFCAAIVLVVMFVSTIGCQSSERRCPNNSTMRINYPPVFPPQKEESPADLERRETDSRERSYPRRPSRWKFKLRAKYAMLQETAVGLD